MLGESVPPLLTPFFCRQVPKLFPKYIRAPNGPEAPPVKQLLPGGSHHVLPPKIKGCWSTAVAVLCPDGVTPMADGEDSYLDVEVQLKRERMGPGRGGNSFLEWWVVRLKEAPPDDGHILPMVIFNDKVSPPSLGFLAGYGYVLGGEWGGGW